MIKRGAGWVVVQLILIGGCLVHGPWRCPEFASALAWLGLSAALSGAALLLAGLARHGLSLTPLPVPREGACLMTSGVYGLVRHPIYSGLILVSSGWALATRDVGGFAWAAALAAWLNLKARFEEKILTERFPEYAAYAGRVKRLIPGLY